MKRITLLDERYYQIDGTYYPSVTWILDKGYPKDYAFQQWLKSVGEQADSIKDSAADRGTRVHNAIQQLLEGTELVYGTKYYSELDKDSKALNDTEWNHLCTFVTWWNALNAEHKVELVALELPVYSKKFGFAGTCDAILKVDDKLIPFDWKTSSAIYETYPMQISAYSEALIEMGYDMSGETAILRTGTRHKAGYECKTYSKDETAESFKNFLLVKQIWAINNGDKSPENREIPETLSIIVNKSN